MREYTRVRWIHGGEIDWDGRGWPGGVVVGRKIIFFGPRAIRGWSQKWQVVRQCYSATTLWSLMVHYMLLASVINISGCSFIPKMVRCFRFQQILPQFSLTNPTNGVRPSFLFVHHWKPSFPLHLTPNILRPKPIVTRKRAGMCLADFFFQIQILIIFAPQPGIVLVL